MHDERDREMHTERAFSSLKIGHNQGWQGQNRRPTSWSQGGNMQSNHMHNNNQYSNLNYDRRMNHSSVFSPQSKTGSSSHINVKPQCNNAKNFILVCADLKVSLNVVDAICLGITQMIAKITSNWQIVHRRRKKCQLQIYFMLVMQQV